MKRNWKNSAISAKVNGEDETIVPVNSWLEAIPVIAMLTERYKDVKGAIIYRTGHKTIYAFIGGHK